MDSVGIGVIGCGNISATYLRNAKLFPLLRLEACADERRAAAENAAREHGLRALPVEALLGDPSIELVINLTIPSAHHAVTKAALEAGKHVYTEKPLAADVALARELVALAEARSLILASAPDTFLGAAGRRARQLVDEGAVGRIVAGTAFMMGHGMEHWHPAPAFYYQPGGGPALDMGPYYLSSLINLLGPVRRVVGSASTGETERLITAGGPNQGTRFPVGTPTTILGVADFASGASIAIGMSWDVWRHGIAPIELHGTEGSLRLPDPDTYGGMIELSRLGAEWERIETERDLFGAINWPFDAPRLANYRALAVAETVLCIRSGQMPRTSARFALHTLEVLEALITSSAEDRAIHLDARLDRPAALTEDEARQLLAIRKA